MNATSEKWKHFERLVAAIHQAADQGAHVRWNETISGRRFDVTIRFRRGLYDYLTVIECKDHARPVPVDKVEAFVTKAADVGAHYSVMASSSGFQDGAQEVARKHNMTLIHVTDSSEIDLSIFGAKWGDPIDVLHIQTIELEYADGEKRVLPSDASAMTYYVTHIRISSESKNITLNDAIARRLRNASNGQIDQYRDYIIECPPNSVVSAPDGEFPAKSLARIRVLVGLTKAKTLTGPVTFDPSLLVPNATVRNVLTGEETVFSRHGLPLGGDTVFEAGQFYEQPQLLHYFYCDHITGDLATIYLVESFQLGQLFQAEFTVKTQNSNYYLPVTDKTIVKRLESRLAQLKGTQPQS
jgi:hypothetical protein